MESKGKSLLKKITSSSNGVKILVLLLFLMLNSGLWVKGHSNYSIGLKNNLIGNQRSEVAVTSGQVSSFYFGQNVYNAGGSGCGVSDENLGIIDPVNRFISADIGGILNNGNIQPDSSGIRGGNGMFNITSPSLTSPVITAFSPTSGPVGSSVTITGTGFSTTPAQNIVFFGATQATVTAASSTSLTVTVPGGSTYQYITVTNLEVNLTAYSAKPFIVTLTGNFLFAAKQDFTTGSNPYSLSIGDLDGDGKPDLAVVNQTSKTVSVLRNTSISGIVSFAAPVDLTTGTGPGSVCIGDLDGDGNPDLAVGNMSSNTVSVFRNSSTAGNISFGLKVDFATGTSPISVTIGDLNMDGKPDLVTANSGSANVSVLRNTSTTGNISFAGKVDFDTPATPYSVCIGDIDQNGNPDLAVATWGSKVTVIRITSTPESISVYTRDDITVGTSSLTSIAIGDIDGDGWPDLAVTKFGDSKVCVLRSNVSGGAVSFTASADYPTGINPISVKIGDIDGDGKPDLAVSNQSSSSVSVIRNTSTSGSISFSSKVDLATGTTPQLLSIGDIDGDGKPDLAVAGNPGVSIIQQAGPIALTTFAPASGEVGSSVTITGSGFNVNPAQNIVFFGATKATVTAASGTSLTVTVPLGATYQYISVTNLATNLTAYSSKPFIVTLAGNINFADKQDFASSTNPFSVGIGDLDGDGKPDLAVANAGSNTVSVFRNNSTSGTVSFAAPTNLATGTYPISVIIGDFDGDGKPDLAVTNNANDASGNSVSIFRNTSTSGSISFSTKTDFATGLNPWGTSTGDLDGDGKTDLAVTNSSSDKVSVLRNTSTLGSISFAGKVDYATGSSPRSVCIGDIDGDSKPDLAVANFGSSTVSIYLNASTSGSISFAGKEDKATALYPASVSIGDIDGDGKPDLAAACNGSNVVSVLRNYSTSGTVSFYDAVHFSTGYQPFYVCIGDVDGDGKPDLATANSGDGTVSVLRNTSTSGTVALAGKVDLATGSAPRSVAIGDIDGDGKPDLATGNYSSNTVSIIRQIVYPTISTYSPASGAIGSSVTITGTGFNTTLGQNIVFFGATKATVTAATTTSLTVTVPLGATYQCISVTNLTVNRTAYSTKPFIVTLAGNVNFTDKQDIAAGTNPNSVSTGDLDGDGKPDLAVANNGNNTVSVFLNTSTSGTVSFSAPTTLTTGTNPSSILIGDLDGDGKPDLAVTNGGSNNISIFRNTSNSGNISFDAKLDFEARPGPTSICIGDLNGDGKPDLAVAVTNDINSSVSVLPNTSAPGNISFAYRITLSTFASSAFYSVTIGDLDGDGKPDLAVTSANDNKVSVFLNTSIGSISFAAKVDFVTGSSPRSVTIGDIDGDGKADLAVANTVAGSVSVFRNLCTPGTVSFDAKVDFTTGSYPIHVRIGDLDGDGKPDLALANYISNSVSVLRSTSSSGSISFADKVDLTTGNQPSSVSIGDIDGDGKPDLAVANANPGNSVNGNTVSIIRQIVFPTIITFLPASGAIGSSVTITGTGFNATAAQNIVFFGATQAIVTTASTTSLTVTVPGGSTYHYMSVTNLAVNRTAYSIKPYIVTFPGNINFAANQDITVGTQPYSVSIGDLDGDGKPDLAVGNQGSNSVSLFLNTSTSGTVSFAAKMDLDIGTISNSVIIGDIDGDGKPDLAVSNHSTNTISVFRNTSSTGSISFAGKVSFATGLYPVSLSLGDLNGDANPDLVVANYTGNSISVLRNTSTLGSISFESKVDFTTGSTPRSASIGDLDTDGKPDLVVGHDNGVSLFRNTSTLGGSIGIAAKVELSTPGNRITTVSIGDLDGDAKPDLALANNAGALTVFRNISSSGSFTFQDRVDFTAGTSPWSVSIGDLDGDGKPDLAVTNSSGVSVLRNTSTSGTIGFAGKVDYTTGLTPRLLSIGDLDGDGKPDLATANQNSNTVSIIRQITPVPTIISFTPTMAATGTTVNITGANFMGATAVCFGNTAATSFSVVSATSITAVVANGTTGSVSVTTSGGIATLAGFTFLDLLDWTGAFSTDWNTAGNWNSGAIPNSSVNVNIPDVVNDPVIGSGVAASCNNLTVNSGASLTVASGGTLINGGTVTGNINILREASGSAALTANKYHLVSVPLHPDNNSLSGLFMDSYLFNYIPEGSLWASLGTSTTTELDETKGYMIYYPNTSTTYTFTGQPNTGTFTPTVTYEGNAGDNNFALVPNPYPSNIDWNAISGWTKTNIGNSIWVYNNGSYSIWDGTNSTNNGSRYIAVGQAFFVQTTAASPALIMDNGIRTHTSAPFLKNTSTLENQLRVKALANGMQDEILTGFAINATSTYDPMEDALKLFGAADAPQLYTPAGDNKLSINQLAQLNGSAEVPLHFETEFSGEITLEFSQMESFPTSLTIQLEDRLIGQWVNIRETSQYLFAHNPANATDRFKLHFGSAAGFGEVENSSISSWFSGGIFYLSTPEYHGEKAKVEVYSISGQLLFSCNVTLSKLQQFAIAAKGAVITRVILSNKVLNTKAIVL